MATIVDVNAKGEHAAEKDSSEVADLKEQLDSTGESVDEKSAALAQQLDATKGVHAADVQSQTAATDVAVSVASTCEPPTGRGDE